MRVVQLALIHFESTLLKSMNSVETTQQWCHIFSIGKGGGRCPFNCVALFGRYFTGVNPGIVIQAAHIPGKKNLLADDCQRGQLGYQITEWSLIKRELVNKFSTPNIDV